ncbi:MAG: hypothetical protein KH828_12775 [Clostridiales bacterium]|nr:hypothetical protein [Clostridiales bacterium]
MENSSNHIIKRSFEEKCRSFLKFFIFFSFCLCFSGCQIVEPEKRAYPLVMGIDWKQEEYQIYLGMAQLAEATGQGKQGGEEQQGNGNGALVFSGNSKEEILEKYNKTRELYLDPGHVQAVIFGGGLTKDSERMSRVLKAMEQETALGNSAYVFGTEDPGAVFEQNGGQVQSLGEFLSGIYENRTNRGQPAVLADLYREIHNGGKIPRIPWITVTKEEILVDK